MLVKNNLGRFALSAQTRQKNGNKRLYARQISYGKILVSHLSSSFYDKLIASLFLKIDKVQAVEVLKQFHNKHLRLDVENLASLKSFVNLNDTQYVKLIRLLFCFDGIRVLSPIHPIHLRQAIRIEACYTTLKSTVVNMTKKIAKCHHKIGRLIKVLVTITRPFECMMTLLFLLIETGWIIKSSEHFGCPFAVHQ